MPNDLSENAFLEILAAGARSTADFMDRLTDYHGGAVETEYILTSDVARAFLQREHAVSVEFLNRRILNALVRRKTWTPKRDFGSQRTDVVVISDLVPTALVEVKIGVGKSIAPITDDLNKIAATIDGMKARYAARVRAASLFQVHVRSRRSEIGTDGLKKRIDAIETSLRKRLAEYSPTWPEFDFRLVSLQGEAEGFVPTSIDYDDEGNPELGERGHATRYYAVLVVSKRKLQDGVDWRTRLQE